MNPIECLSILNGWWATGKVDSEMLHKRIRTEFSSIVKDLRSDRVFCLSGPSGCGKTSLLYQTVDYMLRLKLPSKRILMLRGDDPALSAQGISLRELLGLYTRQVLSEDPDHLSAPVFVFIDEAQRLSGLPAELPGILNGNGQLKIFLSAPSAGFLAEKGGELSRRLSVTEVPPLTPRQFIEFCCTYRQKDFDNILFKSMMPRVNPFSSPGEYVKSLLGNYSGLLTFKNDITGMLGEYILSGGYPAYFGCASQEDWHRKLLESEIDRSLYADILSGNSIKSPEKLKIMLYLIAAAGGENLSFSGIGNRLSLNTVTVINHMGLLSRSGVITVCENYSGRKFGVTRKNKHIYLSDSGFCNALLHKLTLGPDDLRRNIKGICVKIMGDYALGERGRVCYWQSGQNSADFVLDLRYAQLPVDVLCSDDVPRRVVRGLNAFSRVYLNRESVVITADRLGIEKGVCMIPYWLL